MSDIEKDLFKSIMPKTVVKPDRFAWLLTEAGKTASLIAAGTVTTSVLFGHFLPQTIFLDKYQQFLQLYKNGMSVQLPQKLKTRFQRTLDLLQVDKEHQELFQPFYAYGFDIISAGCSYSKYGVIVGLPFYFSHESTNDVDRSRLKLSDESIVWESEEGRKLLDSLVLSESAQMYAMAKEILYRQTLKPLYDTMFATGSCISAYGLGQYLNQRFDFYSKPRHLRIAMYSLIGLFMYGFYIMAKDTTQILTEERIDKELKRKDKVFAEGGKEFYTKIVERNIALRKLMGKEGERKYSVLGNENELFRNKHLPIVHRKTFFDTP